MNEVCPICGDKYTGNDYKVEYHVEYKPEITTNACTGCNLAEKLIRHPELKEEFESKGYYLEKRIEVVKAWTLKNRPLIS